jgi:hypothetical protein
MTDALSPELEEQIRLVELDCHTRQAKIRQSSSMKDVAQLRDLVLRGELRENSHRIRGLTQLGHAAEMRMRELLATHLIELRAQNDLQVLEQLRSHFLHREWAFIKGPWPLLYREAEIESEKVVQRLERETDSRRQRLRGGKK